ncbi:MAG: hypothetical protein ACHQK8_05730 [Bacteroidia bacterium]
MKIINNFILFFTMTFSVSAQQDWRTEIPVNKGDRVEVHFSEGRYGKGEVIFLNDTVFIINSKTKWIDTICFREVEQLYNLTREISYIKKADQKPRVKRIVNDYATRYFVSPSGFGLKQGTGYYQNSMLLLNSVFVGVTDNFSLGGGMLWIYPMYLSARLTGDFNEYLHFGAGYLLLSNVFGSTSESVGHIVYFSMTFGTKEMNFGINYGGNINNVVQLPLYTVNGFYKISDHFALVTESWIININRQESQNANVYSLGGKYITPKSHSVDFGLACITNGRNYFPAPYVAVCLPFNLRTRK